MRADVKCVREGGKEGVREMGRVWKELEERRYSEGKGMGVVSAEALNEVQSHYEERQASQSVSSERGGWEGGREARKGGRQSRVSERK